mmetsp:Transcript_44852/g.174076  ORF Transcript_44852/g.174076 Transcript_44852/m.174076 type:complete len:252 (+) Transcript_44852:2010-2765(+)
MLAFDAVRKWRAAGQRLQRKQHGFLSGRESPKIGKIFLVYLVEECWGLARFFFFQISSFVWAGSEIVLVFISTHQRFSELLGVDLNAGDLIKAQQKILSVVSVPLAFRSSYNSYFLPCLHTADVGLNGSNSQLLTPLSNASVAGWHTCKVPLDEEKLKLLGNGSHQRINIYLFPGPHVDLRLEPRSLTILFLLALGLSPFFPRIVWIITADNRTGQERKYRDRQQNLPSLHLPCYTSKQKKLLALCSPTIG